MDFDNIVPPLEKTRERDRANAPVVIRQSKMDATTRRDGSFAAG